MPDVKKQTTQVVKNSSQAYGYNYASLSDIANAGFEIPKMRLKADQYGEFIEYFDGTDWQTGAKVVVPEMRGSNDAQRYGSALTYARRYTVQMALGLASEDDKDVETNSKERQAENQKANDARMDFDAIRKKLDTLDSLADVDKYAKEVGKVYQAPTEKQRYVIESLFTARREKIVSKQRTVSA